MGGLSAAAESRGTVKREKKKKRKEIINRHRCLQQMFAWLADLLFD